MNIDWNAFTPWASLAGGLLIGLASALYVLGNGRIAGIAGIVCSPLRALTTAPEERHRGRWAGARSPAASAARAASPVGAACNEARAAPARPSEAGKAVSTWARVSDRWWWVWKIPAARLVNFPW